MVILYFERKENDTKVSKKDGLVKWLVLSFSIFILFGSYYCFDNPAALKNQMYIHFKNYDNQLEKTYEFLFSLLYSFLSLPNVLFPFINGLLIDKVYLNKFMTSNLKHIIINR